jgi:hypothetical protein
VKRLTSEEVRVDESVDRYLGPLADLEGMKPKLLDLILNGPVLNGVSKDVLRQIIRQLYSALAAYEDTRLEPEEVDTLIKDWSDLCTIVGECGGISRVRVLAEADKEGRLVVLPVKPVLTPTISSMLYIIEDEEIYEDSLYEGIVGMSERGEMNVIYGTIDALSFEQNDIGKTVFLTREEAEKALEGMTC